MNKSDLNRDSYMLNGYLGKNGYDWWWHSFTGYHRITGEQRSFFIEYFICNPLIGGNQAILGQLPENQAFGIRPSYGMIKAGTWGEGARQLNNFYPVSEFLHSDSRLNIRIGECVLSEHYMEGFCAVTADQSLNHPEYMSDTGEMSWKLNINKKIAYHAGYGASGLFRFINAFDMFWHAEGIKTEYSGEVVLDGEVYDIIADQSYGYADKNWGSDFTSPWLWISSCNMKSLITGRILDDSAVEFGGGRPKIFGISLGRRLLGGLYYEGRMYNYNFSHFWTRSKVSYRFKEGKTVNVWKIKAENKDSLLELVLKCPAKEMLFINYEAPNGKKLHNHLWNGGTGRGEILLYHKKGNERHLTDRIEIKNAGCEYGEYGT